jgi:hypothetical protein
MVTFENYANPEQVGRNLLKGMAYTLTTNGEIIACGGVMPFWKGVGEAWVVTSPLVEKYRLAFAKVVHNKLSEIIRRNGYERVQTCVHADFMSSRRWVERMGFKPEGLMKKYIGGQDYVRYAWVREG